MNIERFRFALLYIHPFSFFLILSMSWREKIWNSCNNCRQSKWLMSIIKYKLKKKYASMEICCRFLYAESSAIHQTVAKHHVIVISLLESPHGIRFENVYSKSLQQPKYRYLENLLASIEEIFYFTFSTNNDVLPSLPNFIFVFDGMSQARRIWMGHAVVECFYLCQK